MGSGWSWNDYNESYMAERSVFPIYGNLYHFFYQNKKLTSIPLHGGIKENIVYKGRLIDSVFLMDGISSQNKYSKFSIERELNSNEIVAVSSARIFSEQDVPIRTNDFDVTYYLKDTLKNNQLLGDLSGVGAFITDQKDNSAINLLNDLADNKKYLSIHSQPTDSLLKPMMHRSDNFFAEQSLLMVSNERLGYMSDEKIIDTLLKTDFKDLPQKPRWVDGSGLSRYNLFTPQDFVAILNKMKNEFGMDRIKVILATGGEGTISSYYKADSGYIYGKTGTLSGVVAFSGYLYTKKESCLYFLLL
jgi:D-alanyl-D-alanine carboxypeptidase/D-alanyl-D-alanine-endopeptidase (penicillin-binding protein 4)